MKKKGKDPGTLVPFSHTYDPHDYLAQIIERELELSAQERSYDFIKLFRWDTGEYKIKFLPFLVQKQFEQLVVGIPSQNDDETVFSYCAKTYLHFGVGDLAYPVTCESVFGEVCRICQVQNELFQSSNERIAQYGRRLFRVLRYTLFGFDVTDFENSGSINAYLFSFSREIGRRLLNLIKVKPELMNLDYGPCFLIHYDKRLAPAHRFTLITDGPEMKWGIAERGKDGTVHIVENVIMDITNEIYKRESENTIEEQLEIVVDRAEKIGKGVIEADQYLLPSQKKEQEDEETDSIVDEILAPVEKTERKSPKEETPPKRRSLVDDLLRRIREDVGLEDGDEEK